MILSFTVVHQENKKYSKRLIDTFTQNTYVLTNRPIILLRSKKPMQKQDRMTPLSSMCGRIVLGVYVCLATGTIDQLVGKFDSEGFGG